MPGGRLTRQLVVRVTDELHELIERDSVENGRRPAQTIRLILERHYRVRD